jgi:hypothetical protein
MIVFHRFLIATAIVFCAGLAVWLIAAFRTDGPILLLVLGVSFALAAMGLGYYLKNLNRFLHR